MKVNLIAEKNDKGYINLYIQIGNDKRIPIKLNDFNGAEKQRCWKLRYKLFMMVQEEGKK